MNKENGSDQPARDTTFEGVIPNHVWLNYDNQIHGKDRFVIELQVNGIKKNIMDFYIPGLDQSEGHHCGGHNLTWLFTALNDQISALKERIRELECTK